MSRTIFNCDLSQAELRVMALLSDDPWMIEALQEGAGDFFDSHLMPAAFPRILNDYESVDEYKKMEPIRHKEDRTKVKAVVYGMSFGRQARAIAKDIKIPVIEAQTIIDNYLSSAKNLALWRDEVMKAAITPSMRGFLINPFGRRFQSEIITTKNYDKIQREALAFLPQSTSSDIMLSTAIRINNDIKDIGGRVINLVHDALMVEIDDSKVDVLGPYVQRELRRTGEMIFGNKVPFLSEYSHSVTWAGLD